MTRATGLAAIMFVALLAAVIVVIKLVSLPQMFSVRGEGEVKYKPDSARINAGVVAQAEIANDASVQVANTMNEVLKALKEAGVADADVASAGLRQWPIDEDHDRPKEDAAKGFVAAQTIVITVHDLKKLAPVSAAISAAGANDWTVEYFSSDTTALEEAVRKAAIQNAIERANMYATEGNFRCGRLLKLVDSEVNFPSANYYERDFENFGRDASRSAFEKIVVTGSRLKTPLFTIPEPEEQTATGSVDVLFEIE